MASTVINFEPEQPTKPTAASATIECPICWDKLDDGVKRFELRGCSHTFCTSCIVQSILFSRHSVVECPMCISRIHDVEIRTLLSAEQYVEYLARLKKAIRCRTPKCLGWMCLLEDGEQITEFVCSVCGQVNCVKCKVIHTNRQTCADFMDSMVRKEEDRLLKLVLESKNVMMCSKCKVCLIPTNNPEVRTNTLMSWLSFSRIKMLLEKSEGCDFIVCPLCLTQLCWATRGPRWGTGGYGDTTAGCRCGVNGSKCHPSCINCH